MRAGRFVTDGMTWLLAVVLTFRWSSRHSRTVPLEAIPIERLTPRGLGLKRPEDVVVGRDGRVWAS